MFVSIGENRLGNKFINQLFDALSSLINVREMHLELNNLEMIPSYAFRNIESNTNENGNWIKRIRLERLKIISKSLTQISSYAFYELNSLRFVKIESNKALERISAHAFDIAQPFSHSLLIDLRHNGLIISSFEIDAFQKVNRPVRLELAHNNLTAIPRQIFERFLNTDQSNSLHLADNQIHCDCNIYWLLKDRQIYIGQVHDAVCEYFYYNIWMLEENLFRNCDQDAHYKPKLLLRNSARFQSNAIDYYFTFFISFIVLLFF